MRRTVALALVIAVGILAASARQAAAEIGLGPRLSLELGEDGSDFAIGAEVRIPVVKLGKIARFDVRPTFDYYFIDDDFGDATVLQFAGDAQFAFFVPAAPLEPYALAGLSVIYQSVNDDSETDVGFNLGGGARFLPAGRIQPFVELRITLGGDVEPILLTGGVQFII